jgi:superfamily I DNA and RNA helicase
VEPPPGPGAGSVPAPPWGLPPCEGSLACPSGREYTPIIPTFARQAHQVSFEEDGENDIWLTKIYRTNRYVLVSAHTLGFGIYRPKGQVQAFDPPNTWEKIGYKLLKGKLNFGEEVVLERSKDAHDQFAEQIFTKDKVKEFIKFRVFDDKQEEITAVFDQLKEDIKEGISTKNILLIANTPEEAKSYYLALKQKAWQDFSGKFPDLFNSNLVDDEPLNIKFHLVGNTTTPEEVFQEGSVAVMHIYRAKGLEAPVVYVLGCENAEPHEETSGLGVEVVRRRNFIFTAITRAHGWVRIFGTGEKADSLRKEFYNLKKNEFRLAFRYPSKEEVDRMRAIRIEARKNDQVDEIANRDSEKLRSLALNAVLKELKRAGYSDDVARRLAERLIRSKDKPS